MAEEIERLSTTAALALGYQIVRGSYQDTTDDRLDRWYIDRIDSRTIDRRGAGYCTRRAALDALAEQLA